MAGAMMRESRRSIMSKALWVVQVVLAGIFLVSGSSKLIMPPEVLTAQSPFPLLFIQFIGVCEILGALGLLLPGLTRIRPALTPLAAAGLTIIMIGATVSTIAVMGLAMALLPLVVGLLAALVVYGRLRLAPLSEASRGWRLQPAG
jgi:uncharacterized membrane protein YphA (DoxX/SURF4 family)